MKNRIVAILTIASMVCLCGCGDKKDADIENRVIKTIEVETTSGPLEDITDNDDTVVAFLDTYRNWRSTVDSQYDTTRFGDGGKNGVLYVDSTGAQTNNPCFEHVMRNKKFVDEYWNNDEKWNTINAETENVAPGLAKRDKPGALVSMYFNILDSSEYNGGNYVTRKEFMEALGKFHGVKADKATSEFEACVGVDPHNLYAQEVDKYCFINAASGTLNDTNYNGPITRFEVVYALLSLYFPDYLDEGEFSSAPNYDDVTNAGQLAKELGYKYKDNEHGDIKGKPLWEGYILDYCLKHKDKGVDDDMYKVLAIAHKLEILLDKDGYPVNESGWYAAATKEHCMSIMIKTLEAAVKEKGYSTDTLMGAEQ